ncbi:MAG: 3-phosphoshikimate 1-carboxyvinyltransferase [Gemmataceae bacterium]
MGEGYHYPAILAVSPLTRPPQATIQPPGSKSITNRALVLAALSSVQKPQVLRGCLRSEDTEVCLTALRQLGYEVEPDWTNPNQLIRVFRGQRSTVPVSSADLFVGNSGTSMRFLTALLALGQGRFRLDGVPRMRERPIGDLLDALTQLGIHIRSESDNGCPPVVLEGGKWQGGRVSIRGEVSSQFLSGLLMAAPFAPSTTLFEVAGEMVSQPYIEMTRRMMHQWHLSITTPTPTSYLVPGLQATDGLPRGEYQVEPDASAASYFFAAAAITGGRITVPGLAMHSLQGDVCFVDVLERMGCKVERGASAITVTGGALRGTDVGMNDISDTVMTLGVVALFAEGPTTIRNVGHIRHKETDRLAALATELTRLGAQVEEFADGLTIHPRPLKGAHVQTYNDHRMAMSLALVGLRVPGVVIDNPGCVAKTYPGFFTDLERLG